MAVTLKELPMAQSLTAYLDLVKRTRPEEIVMISREIDPAYELTALVVKLEREGRRRPVLLFERVKGSKFPVLTNLHASRSRLAAAMGAAPEETQRAYLRAMEKPIAPKVVRTGPVKEVVLTGDRVDLGALPQILHHEGDAGAYVTAAISFAKDPTADVWNCAYNRLQIKGRDTTSIHLTTGKHLWEFHRIAEARGMPLPVALVVGVLSTIPIVANLYRAVRAMVPSVKAVRVPGPFTCYVSLEQRVPGQAKNAILAALGADLYVKRVVVVDEDVDVFDDRQVTWAIATRCQPDRDITIISNARGSDLDPSAREDGYTAKWGVDATAKPSLAAYTPRHRLPADVWQRIDLKDFFA